MTAEPGRQCCIPGRGRKSCEFVSPFEGLPLHSQGACWSQACEFRDLDTLSDRRFSQILAGEDGVKDVDPTEGLDELEFLIT